MSQRWYRAGARALALALTKNPYRRDALYSLGVGYYQLRDSTNLLAVAQRLVQLDPLNRSSLKLLAGAWDLRGRRGPAPQHLAPAGLALAPGGRGSRLLAPFWRGGGGPPAAAPPGGPSP